MLGSKTVEKMIATKGTLWNDDTGKPSEPSAQRVIAPNLDHAPDRLATAPFGGANPTGAAYYLCKPSGRTPTAAGRRLERWLVDLAAEWRAANRRNETGDDTAPP